MEPSERARAAAALAVALAMAAALAPPARAQEPARPAPFAVRVIDEATGRGVPLVELETVNRVLFVTDSAGLAAIDEPGLMGQQVWLSVRSHGYEMAADGFGFRGVRLQLTAGGEATVKLRRINVAERLYRVTGAGIYRDSVRLGQKTPLREPLLAGGVLGQDSVVTAIHRGRLLWFWGDTARASYPLGQFSVSGASSALPADGGLDPSVGVDLRYFVGEDGFSREMMPLPEPGAVWIGGACVLPEAGEPRLLCHYARMKSLGERLEHGIAMWNEETELFERRRPFPLERPLHPFGHPIRVREDETSWLYFCNPYPVVRVRERVEDLLDPTRYEAFTCLQAGAGHDGPIARDAAGRADFAWRRDTAALAPSRRAELVKAGELAAGEGLYHLADVETGAPVIGHGGSVSWNAHRRRWVMIALEAFGRSMLGEVWYAESETPLGPWVYARRVVTHDRYSFYNVKHHPYFDEDGGRRIYFEGTYTTMFSGNDRPTPRYDYNQVMYRLDLDDPRVRLPAAVYRWTDESGVERLGTWDDLPEARRADAAVAFHAFAPDRPAPGSVPVFAADDRLVATAPDPGETQRPAFHVLPLDGGEAAGDAPPHQVALFEHRAGDRRVYRTEDDPPGEGWERAPRPLGRVFRAPRSDPPRAAGARPSD